MTKINPNTFQDVPSHLFRPPESPNRTTQPKVETEQERRRRLDNQTHTVSELEKLPTSIRYWGIGTSSITYDSGYGDRGQTDMTTNHLLTITWFETDEALEAWVLKCVERRESYKIFRAEPVKTEVKAVFSITK